MTPHALKLKLAALDGWKPVPANGFTMYKRDTFSVNSHHDLPNYPEDLNALRRIEMRLTTTQKQEYWEILHQFIRDRTRPSELISPFDYATVCPIRRAEALLIVLGK